MSKERTWPYSLLTPEELSFSIYWNVRKPSGERVFSVNLDKELAIQAKDALNEAFDLGGEK